MMFRKIVKRSGNWTVLELSDKEVADAVERVRRFNHQAYLQCYHDAMEIVKSLKLVETDENVQRIAQILFDKFGLQTFSVLKNHADSIMG